jgi:hypothetical protein
VPVARLAAAQAVLANGAVADDAPKDNGSKKGAKKPKG